MPIDSLLQDNPQPRRSELLDADNARPFPIEENSFAQLFRERRLPEFVERHFVFLFHFEARMREALGERAIAREQEQTFALRIQPADVEEAGKFRREQIEDRVVRVRVAPCRNEARRLVQHDRQAARRPNESTIDLDVIVRRNLGGKVRHRLPVDRNPTGRDELVAMPARPEPGGGEETVEAQTA